MCVFGFVHEKRQTETENLTKVNDKDSKRKKVGTHQNGIFWLLVKHLVDEGKTLNAD